ncbi:hypothetical protein MAP00_004193 [Monascus purpureus]|nr:hypothetical protein MAP00_004193 [Monascus purpureus]
MIIDAQDTRLPSGRYTHIFTAFAFNLFPDPKAALREYFRLLQTKGTLAISVWKKCNWFEIVKDALSFLPGNLPLPTQQDEISSLHKKGWDSESCIRGFLEEAGFKDVDASTTEKKSVLPLDEVADACQMIAPFVVSQFWTEEQRDQYAGMVPEAIKKHLAEKFGEGKPGFLEAQVIIAVARKG